MHIRFRTRDYFNCAAHTIYGINIIVWFRLLAKNKFAIDIRFLPKVLFLTLNSIMLAPIQFYEHLRFRKRITASEVKAPLFILGYWRSGTTHLHNMLSKDPSFAYCATYEALAPNMFLAAGRLVKKMLETFMPATRPQDNVKAGADLPIEEEFALGNTGTESFVHGYYFPHSLQNVLQECVLFNATEMHKKRWQRQFCNFLKKLSFKYSHKRLLIKSPANTARVQEILELFPDAKFIHIHRHPYSIFQSNVNLYEKILPLLSFQKPDDKAVEEFIYTSYSDMHKKFIEAKKALKEDQLYEMSYDKLVSSPVEELKKAYQKLNLPYTEDVEQLFSEELKTTQNYKTNYYAGLDGEHLGRINDEWAFMFAAYGYEMTGC